MAVEQLVIED